MISHRFYRKLMKDTFTGANRFSRKFLTMRIKMEDGPNILVNGVGSGKITAPFIHYFANPAFQIAHHRHQSVAHRFQETQGKSLKIGNQNKDIIRVEKWPDRFVFDRTGKPDAIRGYDPPHLRFQQTPLRAVAHKGPGKSRASFRQLGCNKRYSVKSLLFVSQTADVQDSQWTFWLCSTRNSLGHRNPTGDMGFRNWPKCGNTFQSPQNSCRDSNDRIKVFDIAGKAAINTGVI